MGKGTYERKKEKDRSNRENYVGASYAHHILMRRNRRALLCCMMITG